VLVDLCIGLVLLLFVVVVVMVVVLLCTGRLCGSGWCVGYLVVFIEYSFIVVDYWWFVDDVAVAGCWDDVVCERFCVVVCVFEECVVIDEWVGRTVDEVVFEAVICLFGFVDVLWRGVICFDDVCYGGCVGWFEYDVELCWFDDVVCASSL